jgi:hypothetical protein
MIEGGDMLKAQVEVAKDKAMEAATEEARAAAE